MDIEKYTEEAAAMSYGKAMEQLDNIVRAMQADDCDIDRLSEYTQCAMILLKVCKEKLLKTDEDIKQCLLQLG